MMLAFSGERVEKEALGQWIDHIGIRHPGVDQEVDVHPDH